MVINNRLSRLFAVSLASLTLVCSAASTQPNRRSSATLWEGLRAAWTLSEASDVRYDSGPNGLDLSDINTVGSATGNTYPLAADFERSNSEYLTRSSSAALQFSTSMTVAVWIKLESDVSGVIASKDNYGASQREYTLYYSFTGKALRFAMFDSGGSSNIASAAISTGTWYLVIGKYDGTTHSLRVNDGTAVTAAYSQTLNNTAAAFAVGADFAPSAADFFDGLVGPLMLWDRALTRQEERDLYNIGLGIKISQW